ncbi:MAG: AAA family ATPase [Actinobacteria bacterium]|nr:AAA family ATPase [Actinomycetota bacterium]
MNCESCNKRPATMRLVARRNDGQEKVAMLCGICAHRFQNVMPRYQSPWADKYTGTQLSPKVFSEHQFPTQRHGVFAGFSRKTQEILKRAETLARERGVEIIGTSHILRAILVSTDNPCSGILEKHGVHVNDLDRDDPGNYQSDGLQGKQLQFSPDALWVLEMAQNEAVGLSDTFVEPEHLTLAILDSKSSAATWMKSRGADFEAIENVILENLAMVRYNHSSIEEASPEEMIFGPERSTSPEPSSSGALSKYARNLNELAEEGKLMPTIGRESELSRMIRILCRMQKNNPILLGEAGVGKTAIVESLAQHIVDKNVPERLRSRKIYQVDLNSLIAGTQLRGEFESRLKGLMDEVTSIGSDAILFIDETHNIVGAGSAEGSMDAGNILKPALARGQFCLIGATTMGEYSKYIESDPALSRRFQPLLVGEPSLDQAVDILEGIKSKYESHHHVNISPEAVSAAVTLSSQYLTDRFLPDKAIDLMDEACSLVSIENDEKKQLRVVIADDIAQIVSSWTGIPLAKMIEPEKKRLLMMEQYLHERMVNQESAVKLVSDVIRRSRAGLKDPGKPNGSFIFAGPTGVGKTELARCLAEFLFDSDTALVKFDMSEYSFPDSVTRLIGAPPGLVGHEQGGQLTEKIKFRPYSVVLFDEMEKAHPQVLNILLQITDDGRLTDGRGKTINFKNTVVIMTTNIGSNLYKDPVAAGNSAELHQQLIQMLENHTSTELINRMDGIVFFDPLTGEQIEQVVNIQVGTLAKRLLKQSISLTISRDAISYISAKGYDENLGARPAKRVIQNELEAPLSGMILNGSVVPGTSVGVSLDGDRLVLIPCSDAGRGTAT